MDIKELEIRKEAKEKEAVRCRELRDYLYEDFREGIISKEDYKELHDGYTEKRKKAEEAVRSIDQQISEVLESKSDKYHWLDYFAEHQNIQELTRTVAVELIDQILVYDKNILKSDLILMTVINPCYGRYSRWDVMSAQVWTEE